MPLMATECCSCLSQRGVDFDACPNPRPSNCVERNATDACRIDCDGAYVGQNTSGRFFNNEISSRARVEYFRALPIRTTARRPRGSED